MEIWRLRAYRYIPPSPLLSITPSESLPSPLPAPEHVYTDSLSPCNLYLAHVSVHPGHFLSILYIQILDQVCEHLHVDIPVCFHTNARSLTLAHRHTHKEHDFGRANQHLVYSCHSLLTTMEISCVELPRYLLTIFY